jgi:ferric-dicitrate binding protein FerR (iron transport regulator)
LDLNRRQWILIQRYVTGNADLREHRIIERWIERYPENKRLIQKIWELSPTEDFEVDSQKAWEKFHTRNKIKSRKKFSRNVSKVPLYVLRVAAVILVTAFAVVFMRYTMINEVETEQVSEFYVMQTLETERGEKARVTFSDGTKVTLNSESSLRFPTEFHGSKREVYLEGEAFFDVNNDANQPFIVYAQDAEVQVLGTEFNVKGWENGSSVEVAVLQGKVAVGPVNSGINTQDQVILTDGFFTSITNGGKPAPPQRVNITNHLIWTRGGIHFDNEPMFKVVRDIERRFNVRIDGLSDDLMEVPYTGTFQYADLDEVLSIIGVTVGFDYQRDEKEIIINGSVSEKNENEK